MEARLSRPIRKSSRRSSPYSTAVRNSPAPIVPEEPEGSKKKTFLDKWVEPPLRTPVPSFMDYKGLERGGVLENMMPLGSMPTAKAKAKAKADPSLRRLLTIKNGGISSREVPVTPETESVSTSRRIESHEPEGVSQASAVQATPTLPQGTSRSSSEGKRTPAKLTSSQLANPAGVKMTPQKERLRQICEQAVEQAIRVEDDITAKAMKKLFYDSFDDSHLNDLLVAVGAPGGGSPRLREDFQTYVKSARKAIKKTQHGRTHRSYQSLSKSPSKPERTGAANGTRINVGKITQSASVTPADKTPTKPSTVNGKSNTRSAKANASAIKSESTEMLELPARRELRRTRRSKSNSSAASSLTSLESSELDDPRTFGTVLDKPSSNGVRTPVIPAITTTTTTTIPSPTYHSSDSADATLTAATDAAPARRRPPQEEQDQMIKDGAPAGPRLHTFMPVGISSSSSASKSAVNALKRNSIVAGLDAEDIDEDPAIENKRQKLTRIFPNLDPAESQVRDERGKGSVESESRLQSANSTRPPRTPKLLSDGPRLRLISTKRAREEDDPVKSPALSISGGHIADSRTRKENVSRPATPDQSDRPAKKAKKAPRVKLSPMKKKSGVIAGTSRFVQDRASPSGNGNVDSKDDDNQDYCAACSGSGELLCCDGCDRSFHLACLDPPTEIEDLPDEWFCYVCAARRNPVQKVTKGLFGPLLTQLQQENPAAYELPTSIRNYFEGVKTSDQGEYEEALIQKPRTRAGYEELPDHMKLKDTKGQVILCFKCGASSLGNREIISCDYCALHWHLDCLDPPLANPPSRSTAGKVKTWMCPNHVDRELLAIDPNARSTSTPLSDSGHGMRTYRMRRPKKTTIFEPTYARGFKNNGLIEIANNDDDAFSTDLSRTVRLPEDAVKLDFIAKVRRERERIEHEAKYQKYLAEVREQERIQAVQEVRAEMQQKARQAASLLEFRSNIATSQAQAKANFDRRSFVDKQVALNLAQLAGHDAKMNLFDSGRVEGLISTLIAEAPAEVRALMEDNTGNDSTIPPSPPSSETRPEGTEGPVSESERKQLLLLQELIKRRLEAATVSELALTS